MPSAPDVPPADDPILFQEPPRGPGRPRSSTSTSTTPPPGTSPEPPNPLEEPSTPAGPDSSTSDHRGDPGESESEPVSLSPGSGEPGGLAGAIRAGILTGTHAAHNLATDDIGRVLGAYLVTKRELDEASEGAARILQRKVPAGLVGRDVQDGVRVGVALASWLGRQFQIWTRARAARRAPALGPAAQTEDAGHDLHQ